MEQCEAYKEKETESTSYSTWMHVYGKEELIAEYNRARVHAVTVGNEPHRNHLVEGALALVRNKESGRFENDHKHQFITMLGKNIGLVDSEGVITTENESDVIMLCSKWIVNEPNDSASKLSMCNPNERNVVMQNIIIQAIIEGKRSAEEDGYEDLDFYEIGAGHASWDPMQVVEAEWVQSTIMATRKWRLQDLPFIRSQVVSKGNRGILFNKRLRSGDIVIVKKPDQKKFAYKATYNVVVTRNGNEITTDDSKGRRETVAVCNVTKLKGFHSVFEKRVLRKRDSKGFALTGTKNKKFIKCNMDLEQQ